MALGYNAPGVAYDSAYNYDGTGGVEALSGTASGTSTTSGSAVGREGSYGTVSGSSTTSGSASGILTGAYGAVTGTSTTSGSAVGSEGSYGAVTGTSTTTGSATGTGGDTAPDQPAISFGPPIRRHKPTPRRRARGRAGGYSVTAGHAYGTWAPADSDEELVLLGLI